MARSRHRRQRRKRTVVLRKRVLLEIAPSRVSEYIPARVSTYCGASLALQHSSAKNHSVGGTRMTEFQFGSDGLHRSFCFLVSLCSALMTSPWTGAARGRSNSHTVDQPLHLRTCRVGLKWNRGLGLTARACGAEPNSGQLPPFYSFESHVSLNMMPAAILLSHVLVGLLRSQLHPLGCTQCNV